MPPKAAAGEMMVLLEAFFVFVPYVSSMLVLGCVPALSEEALPRPIHG